MNTSAFLTALRAHPALPLVFRCGSATLASGYHLTEVKRVSYETMDCGAMTHRWAETQFELWVPPLVGGLPGRGPMSAGKFTAIIDRVDKELPLDDETEARVHASLGAHPAALYDIAALHVHEGQLLVELTPDRTRCKSAERRAASLTGGCCGSAASAAADTSSPTESAGCGCDHDNRPVVASRSSACCT